MSGETVGMVLGALAMLGLFGGIVGAFFLRRWWTDVWLNRLPFEFSVEAYRRASALKKNTLTARVDFRFRSAVEGDTEAIRRSWAETLDAHVIWSDGFKALNAKSKALDAKVWAKGADGTSGHRHTTAHVDRFVYRTLALGRKLHSSHPIDSAKVEVTGK